MKRSSRVGTDKLNLNPPALPCMLRSISPFQPVNGFQQGDPYPLPDEEVHKSGTGDFDFLQNPVRVADFLGEHLGNQTGTLFRAGSQDHGDIRGVITVDRFFCQLYLDEG